MAFYNNANELLQDAANKGIIQISNIKIIVNNIEIQTPNAINVIDIKKWKNFLQNIIDNSDTEPERQLAIQLLQVFTNFENAAIADATNHQCKHDDHLNFKTVISQEDITNLKIDLANCSTVDDIFKLMNINITPKQLTWKRPIKVNGNLRYYANETNWYIAKKLIKKYIITYSIYDMNDREAARFDKLFDAKNNMLNIMQRLNIN